MADSQVLTDDKHAADTLGPPVTDSSHLKTYLSFVLGGQVFAVPIAVVREVVDLCEIAPLPNAPHDVLGMIDLRGQSIGVIDLAARLGVRVSPEVGGRIVVFEFECAGTTVSLGVVTERVLRVAEVPQDAHEDVPETLSGWRCDAATALARTEDGRAILLDIDRLLRRTNAPDPFDFA
jgi:purine-binding chemotaxis protein CheW